jgi:DNA-binding winged helix-turn-helix (wHTH) protein
VPLPPKPTSLLILLLHQAGTLVPKQHLLHEIFDTPAVAI